jgi:hypothetical protein
MSMKPNYKISEVFMDLLVALITIDALHGILGAVAVAAVNLNRVEAYLLSTGITDGTLLPLD